MSRLQALKAMALTHGDLAVNEDVIGVVDDAVHNSLGDGTGFLGTGIDPLIPLAGVVLGAEDGGAVGTAGFHKLQKVVRLLRRKAADEPLIQDEQIHLPVAFHGVLELTRSLGEPHLLQQFRETGISDSLELPAGGVAKGTGEKGLAAAGGALEDDLVPLFNVLASSETQNLSLVQPAVLMVLNIFNHSTRGSQVSVVETALHPVLLPAVPLRIH